MTDITVLRALFYVVYSLYVLATLIDLVRLGATQQPSGRYARHITSLAFGLHTIFLAIWLYTLGGGGLVEPLGLLAGETWGMIGVMLVVRWRFRLKMHEPLILMIVVVLMTVGHALPVPSREQLDSKFMAGTGLVLFPLHILASYIGYAAFANACAISASYLTLDHALKHRRVSLLSGLGASLEGLDRANVWLLTLGVWMMLAGVVTGAIWMLEAGAGIHGTIKLLLTLAILLMYGVLLVARRTSIVAGRRMAWASVMALVVVVGSLVFVG